MADAAPDVPICYVNGKRHTLPLGRGECTLLQYLRESGLTGTKLGCGEGGCGACTVMVSACDQPGGPLLHRSVNACLCPLYAVEGMHVVTVEGIGNSRDGLHPVQARLAAAHGSQCGFCTPGFVMSMYALLRSCRAPPSEQDIEENLAGNLCRCTGYRPILDAFKVFAKTDVSAYTEDALAARRAAGNPPAPAASGATPPVPRGAKLCPSTGQPCDCGVTQPAAGQLAPAVSTSADKAKQGAPPLAPRGGCEPIFPPELRRRVPAELALPGPRAAWYRPVSLAGLLALKRAHPEARLVVGNTEVGIEMKFKHAQYPVLIGATHVPELNAVQVTEEGLEVGASVTLARFMAELAALVAARPAHATRTFAALHEQLRWFAGAQIRNTASVGGNVVTGSPISDLNPLYMAAGARFTVAGEGSGQREVAAADFFLGYRKVDLAPHEVLLRVVVPFTRRHEYVREFKQAHRREDDIAIVNAGMRVRLAQAPGGSWEVAEAAIAYGGVAPKTIMAPKAAAALAGRPLGQEALAAALAALAEDVWISPDAPGGMVEFRRSLASAFLFRFLLDAAQQLAADAPSSAGPAAFPASHASAAVRFERPPAAGMQYWSEGPEGAVVGEPVRHLSADLQVTGEAMYVDDMAVPNTLHAALVLSTHPHARLLSVDASQALQMEGVAGFFDHSSIPGSNAFGPVIHDEEVFASQVVTCVGQPIGLVVAETEAAARAAARAVRVEYEDLPPLMSCEEAIEAGSFYEDWGHRIDKGDVDAALASGECEHVLEATVRIGGQEHFYLEPNASLAVPGENDEITIFSSSQAPAHTQKDAAHVLGIPEHKVVARTKRLGGGFGGKETRSTPWSNAAAVAAAALRRPVRIALDRDEDMHCSGHRHAFLAKYKVGFKGDGRLVALDLALFNNAGNSLDLSAAIMDRALLHCDCCYALPALRAVGAVCRTNQSSNTAFRGFGGPQGMMVAENWIEHIARTLGLAPEEVRQRNFYQEGDATHFGQALEGCQIQACWQDVWAKADFPARRAAVDAHNARSRWRKRGLALIPTKFGISFTTKFLNQAGALVHIYTDGSVLVTHGGVEMGQGLHTKVAQVAAAALGVPLASVHIAETATDKVPNASPTAASASSDLYGGAVADACAQLNARLAPFRAAAAPGAPWAQLVNAAYLQRVDLSAHGFYATPDVEGFGGTRPFNYFTYGAACSEVELDVLTGDFHLLRTDLTMDVGQSLNPAIDIGQVEGGFVQGLGWCCIEELVWGDRQHGWVRPGTLHTRGPGTYKIPSANDIPLDFRVSLLRNAPCARTPLVHSSKAVGEPPLFLGASAFFALKDACYAARADAGLSGWFPLDSPATPERLRMACADHLTAPYAPADLACKISC